MTNIRVVALIGELSERSWGSEEERKNVVVIMMRLLFCSGGDDGDVEEEATDLNRDVGGWHPVALRSICIKHENTSINAINRF